MFFCEIAHERKSLISVFQKIFRQTCEATCEYRFWTNNQALFPLWWKQNLLNHQKVSIYYKNLLSENFHLLFIFSTPLIVKNSHFFDWIYTLCLCDKSIVDKTRKMANTKLRPQWNVRKVLTKKQKLCPFYQINYFNFSSKLD